MSDAHPEIRTVTLMGGKRVKLRPWTMAQRRELKPRVLAILEKLMGLEASGQKLLAKTLVELFTHAEDEIVDIVRDCIPRSELSGEEWDGIYWTSDVPELALGLWALNFPPESMLGKAMAGLTTRWGASLSAARSSNRSPNPSGNGAKPPASPSSPGADTATPSTSETP